MYIKKTQFLIQNVLLFVNKIKIYFKLFARKRNEKIKTKFFKLMKGVKNSR